MDVSQATLDKDSEWIKSSFRQKKLGYELGKPYTRVEVAEAAYVGTLAALNRYNSK